MNKSKTDEIASLITDQINKGILTTGQKLPSERELAKLHKVTRTTIRNAIIQLQANNLVEIIPRTGVFVRAGSTKLMMGNNLSLPKNKGPELKTVGSFIHLMRSQGKNVIVRYLEPSAIISSGEEIAKQLGIQPTDKVLRRYRIQIIDRVPYRILDTYLLASLTSELVGQEDHKMPLFKWLSKHKNVIATKTFERLICRTPTAEEAKNLRIARSQPVVEMNRWIWGKRDNNEFPFEYSRIICNASLHEFQYSYNIEKDALL